MSQKVVRYADLCCGLGAFHLAFEALNRKCKGNNKRFRCVYACDTNPHVRKAYELNFGIAVDPTDLTKLPVSKFPEVDVLCAGFPCQPYSVSGKKNTSEHHSGNVIQSILRIVDKKRPPYVFLENVPHLLSIDDGKVWDYIQKKLRRSGYTVDHRIVDAQYHNVAQSRKRMYIVATTNPRKLGEDPFRYLVPTARPTPFSSILQTLPTDENLYKSLSENFLFVKTSQKGAMKYRLKQRHNQNDFNHQNERVFSVHWPAPTITTNVSANPRFEIAPKCIRQPNVPELMKLFGFPRGYKYKGVLSDVQVSKYLGNSIVVPVLQQLLTPLC